MGTQSNGSAANLCFKSGQLTLQVTRTDDDDDEDDDGHAAEPDVQPRGVRMPQAAEVRWVGSDSTGTMLILDRIFHTCSDLPTESSPAATVGSTNECC